MADRTALPLDRFSLTELDLWRRCLDAARAELTYSPASDVEECAASIIADTIERLSVGRSIVLPRIDDRRYSFAGLRGDAKTWLRRESARRDREALGVDDKQEEDAPSIWETARAQAEEVEKAEYLRVADAAHDCESGLQAARMAAERIGAPIGTDTEPSAHVAVFYQWVRECSDAQAAADFGKPLGSFRVWTSRARKSIRERLTMAEVVSLLMGGEPVESTRRLTFRHGPRTAASAQHKVEPIEVGEIMFSHDDASREAGSHGPKLTPADRVGTRTGTELDETGEPIDVTGHRAPPCASRADVLATCRIGRTVPLSPEQVAENCARALAQRRAKRAEQMGLDTDHPYRDLLPDETTADAKRDAQRNATTAMRAGRPDKWDTGRTAGKPIERYASHEVRLGADR